MPALDGISIQPRELAVAHFLFRIGFINARDESLDDGLWGLFALRTGRICSRAIKIGTTVFRGKSTPVIEPY